MEFTITRDKIPIYSVEAGYMATPSIGYIKVSRFSATTMTEFRSKLDELKALGMEDLVLDLQGNGGGYLGTAIDMAGEFLWGKKIIFFYQSSPYPRGENPVYTDGRKGERQTFFVGG